MNNPASVLLRMDCALRILRSSGAGEAFAVGSLLDESIHGSRVELDALRCRAKRGFSEFVCLSLNAWLDDQLVAVTLRALPLRRGTPGGGIEATITGSHRSRESVAESHRSRSALLNELFHELEQLDTRSVSEILDILRRGSVEPPSPPRHVRRGSASLSVR